MDQKLNAHIVNFADDFVVCCRGTGAQAMSTMRQMMERLRLSVNEQKTGLRFLPEESADFLGYTIGRCYSTKTGKAYIGTRPSKKSIRKLTTKVSEFTEARRSLLDAEVVVGLHPFNSLFNCPIVVTQYLQRTLSIKHWSHTE